MGFTIEKAKRKCRCYLCNKTIKQGDERVALQEIFINYFAHPICALKVIDKRSNKLQRIRAEYMKKYQDKLVADAL